MKSPELNNLPTPPDGKTGWPWTEGSEKLKELMPDGSKWPKISIVTPSFNQAQFLEETIRSVLLQGYPDLEYLIIDGGSTDGSLDIIKKYERNLTYWVSEPDRGQSHAINKGFEKATGLIGAWINSDDLYLPNALKIIALRFGANPDPRSLVSGKTRVTYQNLVFRKMYAIEEFSVQKLINFCIVPQASTFFTLELFRNLGGVNEKLHMAFDYDLWLHASMIAKFVVIPDELAIWRQHPAIKTIVNNDQSIKEAIGVVFRTYRKVPSSWIKLFWRKKIPFRYSDHTIKSILLGYLYYICLNVSLIIVKLLGWQ